MCTRIALNLIVITVHFLVVMSEVNIEDSIKLAREYSKSSNFAKSKELYKKVTQVSDQENDGRIAEAFYELSNLLENDSISNNRDLAFEYLTVAATKGYAAAQHKLAASYMAGYYGGLIPLDPGRAVLLDYFAAISGDPQAAMALGHRYFKGITVPESCAVAAMFMEISANIAAQQITTRGSVLFVDKSYLARIHDRKFRREIDDEVVDYYRHLAEEGDGDFAASLGNIYTHGSRMIDQDFKMAARYLKVAADEYHVHSSAQLGYLIVQGRAPGTLGEAIRLLNYAQDSKDPLGTLGLGYSMYKGVGLPKNESKAFETFRSIADRIPEAAFYMGEILMMSTEGSKPDPAKAAHAYSHAASRGHILATYRLAHLTLKGLGVAQSCEAAVQGFKTVSEFGDWALALTHAHRKFHKGDKLEALQLFAQMAALGIESAQSNAAYILSRLYCPPWIRPPSATENLTDWPLAEEGFLANKTECEKRALSLHLQSAGQGNGEAVLRVGDYFYYGQAGLQRDKRTAATYYQMAADFRQTHALFNLGLMHEIGDGVQQDFHLAKRFFDQAAEFDEDAKLPRSLALALLQSHQSLQMMLGPDLAALLGLTGAATFPLSLGGSWWDEVRPYLDRLVGWVDSIMRVFESTDLWQVSGSGHSELILFFIALATFMYLHGWRTARARRNVARRQA